MAITYFDRNHPPEGADYSAFVTEVGCSRLTNPRDAFAGDRLVLRMPKVEMPDAPFYAREPRPQPRYISRVTVDSTAAYLRSPEAMFVPEFGTFFTKKGDSWQVVEESLWHSEVYWSNYLRQDARTGWKFRIPAYQTRPLDEPVAMIWGPFAHHYFHWIIDVLPRVWMLRTMADDGRKRRLVVTHAWPGTFQSRILTAYGYTDDDVYYVSGEPVTFSDSIYFAFNSHETIGLTPGGSAEGGGNNHYKGWSPAFLADLYERGAPLADPTIPAGRYEKIYVSRRDAKYRFCENEPALIAFLEARGFQVVCPGELTIDQQVGIFRQARVVVGIHGAGLTNIVWCQPRTAIIEIMPDGYDDMGYRFITGQRGMPFAVVFADLVGEPIRGDHNSMQAANCRVDLELVAQALSAFG